ncbi:sugar O-acyltransferase, sialic acid O-acetyltransferase NeuD family [Pseudomonas benzenivorans]|nr:sugar O-acyltransferase, sialic acid O-acetyltransferase NeuD family [Pseudomonas benzenivorans]
MLFDESGLIREALSLLRRFSRIKTRRPLRSDKSITPYATRNWDMALKKTLLILGAGGHGKAVAEAALLSGKWQRVCFADDRWPQLQESFGCPVVASSSTLVDVAGKVDAAIAAVGNNALREQWLARLQACGLPSATVVHPAASVSPSADLGEGSAVMALAMVGVDVRIGKGVIVNAHVTVDHDAALGDFAHLGVGVHLAGGVRIGARAWLQAGCCAGYQVVVAEGVVLAPGTALIAQ